jgi:hypothetical protein
VVQQAVGTLDEVLRSVQKRLDADEAKALKKLRKRWLQAANQLNVVSVNSFLDTFGPKIRPPQPADNLAPV